jgi:hypothetical protein
MDQGPRLADNAPACPLLESAWPTGAAFLERFEAGARGETLELAFARGEDLPPHEVGALLLVALRFEDRNVAVNLHARVLERRSDESGARLLLGFLPEERERIELALTCAQGQSLPYYQRKSKRVACRLAATVTAADGKRWRATTINLSDGGAAIALGPLAELAIGTTARVALELGGGAPLVLAARVVSVVRSGPQPSVSFEFLFSSSQQRDELRTSVLRLAEAT